MIYTEISDRVLVIMGNSGSNTTEDLTDQNLYVGSSVDPPTPQKFFNGNELSSDKNEISVIQLEERSMAKERAFEISKPCDPSLKSYDNIEIADINVNTGTDKVTDKTPSEDVIESIEQLKEKEEGCSSINTVCEKNYTDGVQFAFDTHGELSTASDESTLNVENIPEYSCFKVENKSNEESVTPDKQNNNAILKMVQRCNESLESLEKDHQLIFSIMNSRSIYQNELKERGLKITTELEKVVKKLTARRKEKDNAISELQAILSKLNERVGLLEQEIQVLEYARKTNSECLLQSHELERPETVTVDEISHAASVSSAKVQKDTMKDLELVEKNEEASNFSHSFALKLKSKPGMDEKSISSENSPPNEKDQGNAFMSETISVNSQDENQSKKDEVKTSFHDSGVRINESESEMAISLEQNSGDHTGEVQQTNMQEEPDTSNTPGSNTRPHCDESNTLDTNVTENQSNRENLTPKEILPVGYWVEKANEVCRMIALEGPADNACGQCNMLCLDTSDSMSGEAFQTMINLSLKFITGLERSTSNQKVGLVCFGGYTGVISRCCMNFTKLKQGIKNLRPGGPSPLSAGILLSLAALSLGVTLPTVNGISFFPRIIILTDGMATPEAVTGCADFTPDLKERLAIRADLDILTRTVRRSANRVYFVPLGKADESFIEPIVRRTHGKIIRPADFDKLIFQFEGELLATELRPFFSNFRRVEPDDVMTAVQTFALPMRGVEMEDLVEYVRNIPPQRGVDSDDEEDNDDHRESDINMPPIGTRVRRGPDWQSNFDKQDSNGPGTVVSHERIGVISIMWDNGMRYTYPYGIQGRFAVMVVDEPRVLQRDQLIEVGCLVKRGIDWRDDEQDGGPGNIGVVFKVYTDGTVGIRWPTGQLRKYKYGKQGYFEVELCDPFDENVRLWVLSMNFQDCPEGNRTSQSRQAGDEGIRIEDVVNSDDRETNPLEEMNKRNTRRTTQTGGGSGPAAGRR